jgi:hypothetical protein
MNLTPTVGSAIQRYTELSDTQIQLIVNSLSSEIFTFVNDDIVPTFKQIITGVTGPTLTIPSYSVGSNRLMVFRNGLLMNSAGLGSTLDTYTETSPTQITLDSPALASEVFLVLQLGGVPNFREDKTGLTGFTLNLINTYNIGDEGLKVWRNGVLIHNSAVLGAPIDRYGENTSSSITLYSAALASEVFTFIDK